MTNSTENQENPIQPQQLTADSDLVFACRKGLTCFTECCRGTNIVLTPYDVIRLKKRLNLSSTEFLALYTSPEILDKTDLPVPLLKHLEDEASSCPFVREDGCLVYEDRPAACRYYPLGHLTLRPKEGDQTEQFYFLVKESHCRGFEEDKSWTVKEFLRDQGADGYDLANAGWANLVVRKRSFPPNVKITSQAKEMFFLACYDLDRFRRFVFESSFLKLHDIDEQTLEKIKENDEALLDLGITWLEGALFKQGPMTVSEEKAVERVRERTQ